MSVLPQATLTRILGGIQANNLVLLCGAGLSTPAPTRLPSAVAVSRACYDNWSVRKIGFPWGGNALRGVGVLPSEGLRTLRVNMVLLLRTARETAVSGKIKVDVRSERELYGGQSHSIVVEVTNVGDQPLHSVEVKPDLIPGTLLDEDREDTRELDELQDKKRRILREMEEQVSWAYERQRLRNRNALERVVIAYASIPDQIASALTGNRPGMFRIPYWAKEATRISNAEDVSRVEQQFIEMEEDEKSFLRKSFEADKHKLSQVLKEIKESHGDPTPEAPLLHPGDTVSFSFKYRALNLYRQRKMDCLFGVRYRVANSTTVGTASATETLSFYASSFAVPFGAFCGAIAGYIIRVFLIQDGAERAIGDRRRDRRKHNVGNRIGDRNISDARPQEDDHCRGFLRWIRDGCCRVYV